MSARYCTRTRTRDSEYDLCSCGGAKRVVASRCRACWNESERRRDPVERFWLQVDTTAECWTWTGCRRPNGYGQFMVGHGKPVNAHRFSWTIAHGDIPDGLMVLHRCDVRHCVNPAHLFLGTAADNTADMYAKGRARPRGVQPAWCRLCARPVRRIPETYRWVHIDAAVDHGPIPTTQRPTARP